MYKPTAKKMETNHPWSRDQTNETTTRTPQETKQSFDSTNYDREMLQTGL